MSKIPPQLRQPVPGLLQTATAFALRHFEPPLQTLENFLAGREHFVQRFLEICGALGKWLPHLSNILLEALFYLLSKELLESSVAETFGVFGRVVRDDVGHESAREPLGALVGILGEEGIERTSGTPVTGRRSGNRWRCGCARRSGADRCGRSRTRLEGGGWRRGAGR